MENIINTSVSEELANDYLNYAITTLNRSLPGAIDGLKLSQRRILQCGIMDGLLPSGKYVKSAKLSGSVMGKLHPHSCTYQAMVRMSNPAELNHPTLDLNGNAGGFSPNGQRISNDPAASLRYTGIKLSQFAYDVYFADDSYKFCETRDNYDNTIEEIVEFVPVIPMGLFNGGSGIACGYSTNLPSYNLREFNRYFKKYVENKKAKLPCFDFPFGTNIVKNENLIGAMQGKGNILLHSSVDVDKKAGKIIIKELPTGNPETFCEKVKKAYLADKIPMLGDIKDLSDQSGIHIEVFTKPRKKSQVDTLLGLLYKNTNLQDNIAINQVLLYGSTPRQTYFNEILDNWFVKRKDVLLKQFRFNKEDLENKINKLNILYKCTKSNAKRKKLGLVLTTSDKVEEDLGSEFNLNGEEVSYILSLSVRKITRLNSDDLIKEITSLKEDVRYYSGLIKSPNEVNGYILDQVDSIAKKYGKKRRTQFVNNPIVESAPRKTKVKEKTSAELWMEKALKEGEKLKKPIKKRGINGLIKKYYTGETEFKSLDEAWEHEKKTRNGVKVPRKRKKAVKRKAKVSYKWVKTREDAIKACKDNGLTPLGARGITQALNKGILAGRIEKYIHQELRRQKKKK